MDSPNPLTAIKWISADSAIRAVMPDLNKALLSSLPKVIIPRDVARLAAPAANAAALSITRTLERSLTDSDSWKSVLAAVVSRPEVLEAALNGLKFQIPGSAVGLVKDFIGKLDTSSVALTRVGEYADGALEALRQETVGDIGGPETRFSADGWPLPEGPNPEADDAWSTLLAIYTIVYPQLAAFVVGALRTIAAAKTDVAALLNPQTRTPESETRAATVVGSGTLTPIVAEPVSTIIITIAVYVALAIIHEKPESGDGSDAT